MRVYKYSIVCIIYLSSSVLLISLDNLFNWEEGYATWLIFGLAEAVS